MTSRYLPFGQTLSLIAKKHSQVRLTTSLAWSGNGDDSTVRLSGIGMSGEKKTYFFTYSLISSLHLRKHIDIDTHFD
jgi:hypothetical protein